MALPEVTALSGLSPQQRVLGCVNRRAFLTLFPDCGRDDATSVKLLPP